VKGLRHRTGPLRHEERSQKVMLRPVLPTNNAFMRRFRPTKDECPKTLVAPPEEGMARHSASSEFDARAGRAQ